MEQQQRSLIFTAAVGLIILAIIVGSIYYLVKFIQGRVASNSTPQASVSSLARDFVATNGSQFIVPSPEAEAPQINNVTPDNQNPTAGQQPTSNERSSSANKKVYNAGSFQLAYPNNWGILKCNNSANVEFDPNSPADSSLACNYATKPITVVIGDVAGCEGDTTKVGNIEVVKSQASEGSYIKYQWCTKTTPVLNITHRVSQGGQAATSKQDFAKQVEEIIAGLSFSRGS